MALYFDGVNSVVTGPKIALGNTITLSAWVYSMGSGTQDPGIIICHGGETATGGAASQRSQLYLRRNTTNQIIFVVGSVGGTVGQWASTATVAHNAWHHIAVTFNYTIPTTAPIFYYDGNLSTVASTISAFTGALPPEPQVLYIGGLSGSMQYGYKGRIQDVAIWRRNLANYEIYSVYYSGPFAAHSTAGLGPYYTFRDAPTIDGVDRSWRGWDAGLTSTIPAPDNPATDRGLLQMIPSTSVSEALALGLPLPVITPQSSRVFTPATDGRVELRSTLRDGSMTLAVWVQRTSGAGKGNVWMMFCQRANAGASHGFNFFLDEVNGPGSLRFEVFNTGTAGVWIGGSIAPADLTPHHVALVYDYSSWNAGTVAARSPKFYLDGVLQGGAELSIPTAAPYSEVMPWHVGGDPGFTYQANGRIQGLSMWGRPLTATEIMTVYTRGTFAVDHNALRLYLTADGRDLSGNALHAVSIKPGSTLGDPLPEKFPSPDFAEPVWLAKIGDGNASGGGPTQFLADRDFAGNDDKSTPTTWDGALVDDPDIERSTTDTFWGYEELQQTTLRIANHDGKYNALWDDETRERPVKIWRGDGRTGRRYEEFTGMIVKRAREDYHVALDCANLDLAAFETEIPDDTITTGEFGTGCPAAGEIVPVLFGNVPKVTLPHVKDDIPGNNHWYLLPTYCSDATITLYREAPEAAGAGVFEAIGASEYSTNATVYPGRRIVSFVKRQEKFGGGLHTIVADITQGPGWNWTRNCVWAIWTIISLLLKRPTDYDLDATNNSWSAATAAWDAANSGLGIDGLLDERKPARQYLDELLMICGGRLYFDKAWRITLDTKPTYASIHIRDGLGDGEQNLVTPRSRSVRDTKDQISVYKLEHRWDFLKKEYTQTKQRPVWVKGVPKIVQSNFLRNGTLADKVLDRLAKEEQYGSEEMEGELSPEATPVRENQIARATYAGLGLTGDYYRIYKITRQVGTFPVTCRRYHPFMYDYIAAPIDGDPSLGTESDYSNVVPVNPTLGSTPAYGVDLLQDGTYVAAAHFFLTTPAGGNYSFTRVDWRIAGNAAWFVGMALEHAQGAIQIRLSGLITGATLDFRFVTVNKHGLASTGLIVAGVLMPRDTVAPAVPGGYVCHPGVNRSVLIAPPVIADRDFKHYEFNIASSTGSVPGGAGSITYGSIGPATGVQGWLNISYDGIPINTPLYLRLRAVDYSGNLSDWGGDAPFGFYPPGACTGVSLVAWYVKKAQDGGTTTDALIGFNSPAGASEVVVDYWHHGVESWGTKAATSYSTDLAGASGLAMVIKGLTPGLPYSFTVRAVTPLGLSGPGVDLIYGTSHSVTPGDATSPSIPSNLAVSTDHRTVFVSCLLADGGADTKSVEWQIHSGANGTGSTIANGNFPASRDNQNWTNGAITYPTGVLAYGTTYHVRVQAVDYTGNRSGYSASVSFTYFTQDTADITIDAVSDVAGAGLPSTSTFVAAGLGTYIKLLELFITCDGTEDILGFGNVTILNTEGVTRLVRVRVINYAPAEHAGLPIESTCGAGEQISFTAIAIDGAPGAGSNNVQLQVAMAGTATQTWAYGLLQATKLKR
jgi:hypothetical protein